LTTAKISASNYGAKMIVDIAKFIVMVIARRMQSRAG
jgi:hypothetical protein